MCDGYEEGYVWGASLFLRTSRHIPVNGGLDREGRVTGRVFRESYRTRWTGGSLALQLGVDGAANTGHAVRAPTEYLDLSVFASDAAVAPGQEFAVIIAVTPEPGVHVCAPGDHPYRALRFQLEPDSLFTAGEPILPGSEIYHFKPLDEHVAVFSGAFRVVVPVAIRASRELAAASREPDASVTLRGTLAFQACDGAICFVPEAVPVRLTLGLRPLESK